MDLTRWNRAGLDRIRYVDGNAATYLEELRVRLAQAFPEQTGWMTVHPPGGRLVLPDSPEYRSDIGPIGADAVVRNEQIAARYQAPPADWAWEIARAFARACHVLTEHIDAYANEGFLRTATQWEYLRRQVQMLGAYPAPPASASTPLVIVPKPEARGLVEAGLRATGSSGSGPMLTFETLDELEVDYRLNGLRVFDYNRSHKSLAGPGGKLRLELPRKRLARDQPIVFQDERTAGTAAWAGSFLVRYDADTNNVTVKRDAPARFLRGYTLLHVGPATRLAVQGTEIPLVESGTWITLSGPLKVPPETPRVGEPVLLIDLERDRVMQLGPTGEFVLVEDVDLGRRRVRLKPLATSSFKPEDAMTLTPTIAVGITWNGRTSRWETSTDLRRWVGENVAVKIGGNIVGIAELKVVGEPIPVAPDEGTSDWKTVFELKLQIEPKSKSNPKKLKPPPEDATIYVGLPEPKLRFAATTVISDTNGTTLLRTELARNVNVGELLVVDGDGGGSMGIGEIREISSNAAAAESTMLVCWHQVPTSTGNFVAYTQFETARIDGWDRNESALVGPEVKLETSEQKPSIDLTGRHVIFESETHARPAFWTRVSRVTMDGIELEHPLPSGDNAFTASDTVIRANVVLAGHGETRPPAVLGSGDSTLSSQSFEFDRVGVSFVADPTMPHGVRASVRVVVDAAAWIQVPNFYRSGPSDPHYTARVTETGTLGITFGDGTNGRRLPTGLNNVRVHARVGTGSEGLVAAGVLTRLGGVHRLVGNIRQPVPTAGGGDREDATGLRQVPRRAFTADRAVALDDVADLVAGRPGILDAKARLRPRPGSRFDDVELVVVPVGGGGLPPAVQAELAELANANSPLSFRVTVVDFTSVPISVDIRVRVDAPAFEPRAVLAAVKATVKSRFELSARRLGMALSRSEVFNVVESVPGVASSICHLKLAEPGDEAAVPTRGDDQNDERDVVFARDHELVHVDDVVVLEHREGTGR